MTGIITDNIYGDLDLQLLLPEDKKGCRKRKGQKVIMTYSILMEQLLEKLHSKVTRCQIN